MSKAIVYSNFLLNLPQTPVGAKHDRRQIIAENINLNPVMLRPTVVY